MNLAEIRKKALKGENGGAVKEEKTAPTQVLQSSELPFEPFVPETVAAELSAPDFSAAEFDALQFVAPEFDAPEFDQALAPELTQDSWRCEVAEPLAAERASDDESDDESDAESDAEIDEFDPAAIIMKGRESASFESEFSLQEESAAASVELLCFRVASEEYAISIMDIKEIIKPREVTEVPRVPGFVRGILSLRGNIIPIFDMRVRLGLCGGTSSERERVIVVKRQGGFAGVLVDEVVQVVRIAEGGIEPPPVVLEGIDREFVLGIGRVSGRMLILLDMEKVLDVGLL